MIQVRIGRSPYFGFRTPVRPPLSFDRKGKEETSKAVEAKLVAPLLVAENASTQIQPAAKPAAKIVPAIAENVAAVTAAPKVAKIRPKRKKVCRINYCRPAREKAAQRSVFTPRLMSRKMGAAKYYALNGNSVDNKQRADDSGHHSRWNYGRKPRSRRTRIDVGILPGGVPGIDKQVAAWATM